VPLNHRPIVWVLKQKLIKLLPVLSVLSLLKDLIVFV